MKPDIRMRPLFALPLLFALASCSILGGKQREPTTLYAPDPRVQADPSWPNVDWQLSISNPEAARMVDSLRIAVRPSPEEVQVYKSASWAKMPTDMVEDAVLRALEDSGKVPAVARQGSGIAADYKLVMDLRRFESDYSGSATPNAVIELNVKLLHSAGGQDVVASRTFVQSVPAASTAVADVVDAFNRGLGQVAHDVAGWTLVSGDQHQRMGHKR
ncbi:ABC transporter [Pseudoluteimonas lycopersici]|uniref:ABC transporter n=1 Tax=Pseudoluteimonas lycopersici TaxID=1324796 RepID=A0A516V7B8_9GAMM|nr:ABC-type transport auxiliary lipoprotein family protein [Lysobacter lycopersici]QDQ74439.1 ABC transporter [Lysobacter lycopersici]